MKRRTPGVSVTRLDYPADEGSQEVWFGQARMVIKRATNPHDHTKLVANEFVCARLGMALGVPIPMGDAGVLSDEQRAWVSAQVEFEGQVFPPADVDRAVAERPWDVAAVATFDVWVGNDDRHEGNIIYNPQVGLWAIDFERALGAEDSGTPAFYTKHRDDAPKIWALEGVEIERKYFKPWTERIKSFPSSGLEAILLEARYRDLLSKTEAEWMTKLLAYRQHRIIELLDRSMKWSDREADKEETWLPTTELGLS